MPDAFAVFRISGQVAGKETLFIKEPPQQKRQHCPEYDEPPVRADLLCVAARESDKSLLHDAIGDAYNQVQREFKVPVSAVVATNAELSSAKLESVVREARRDGVLLFGTVPGELRGVRIWEPEVRTAK